MADDEIDFDDGDDFDDEVFSLADPNLTDGQLEKAFEQGRFRLIQERNDFMLPQVYDFVREKKWINVSPEYQRRQRWDDKKKSALIESFLMGIPVPPVFLYEIDLNRYEVMDGQQRLNTICEFINNELTLSGLVIWPSLNDKIFANLPPVLKRGVNRAKISSNILIADAFKEDEHIDDIRSLVFQRLNTGGEKLNAQELRNCVFSGSFNDLLIELGSIRTFTDAWGIPPHEEHIRDDGFVGDELKQNNLYKTMNDCHIVLRFFAFQDEEKIVGSVKKILDNCMSESRNLAEDEIDERRNRFSIALQTAVELFGDEAFRLPPNEGGRRLLSRPLYDAVMIAIDRLRDRRDQLLDCRADIITATNDALGDPVKYEIVVGRPNTADAIKLRINAVHEIFENAIGQ